MPRTPRAGVRKSPGEETALGERAAVPGALWGFGRHGRGVRGGISLDGKRWVSCRLGFFLPVRVLSRLFRRVFLTMLLAAHKAGCLQFFGEHIALTSIQTFAAYLAPLRKIEWIGLPAGRSNAVTATICSWPFGMRP